MHQAAVQAEVDCVAVEIEFRTPIAELGYANQRREFADIQRRVNATGGYIRRVGVVAAAGGEPDWLDWTGANRKDQGWIYEISDALGSTGRERRLRLELVDPCGWSSIPEATKQSPRATWSAAEQLPAPEDFLALFQGNTVKQVSPLSETPSGWSFLLSSTRAMDARPTGMKKRLELPRQYNGTYDHDLNLLKFGFTPTFATFPTSEAFSDGKDASYHVLWRHPDGAYVLHWAEPTVESRSPKGLMPCNFYLEAGGLGRPDREDEWAELQAVPSAERLRDGVAAMVEAWLRRESDEQVEARNGLLDRLEEDPAPATGQAEERRTRHYHAIIANPDSYDIEEAVQTLTTDTWGVPKGEVEVGDRIVVWKAKGSGEHRGIVALGEVIESFGDRPPQPGSEPFYTGDPSTFSARRLVMRYEVPNALPLWLGEDSEVDAVLGDLSVSRGQGTQLYKVTPDQWIALRDLAGGSPHATAVRSTAMSPTKVGPEKPVLRKMSVEPGRHESYSVSAPRVNKTEAKRRESVLVEDFVSWAAAEEGWECVAYEYRLPDGTRLKCDVFVESENLLIEAKADSSRESIRMAIGQLMDYQRFHGEGVTLGVLVPEKPGGDLLALLGEVGVGVWFRDGDGFGRRSAAQKGDRDE